MLALAHVNDAGDCPRRLVIRAGSFIVRLDTDTHAAELRWDASMSYVSTTTTNDTAEYWGLVHAYFVLHPRTTLRTKSSRGVP